MRVDVAVDPVQTVRHRKLTTDGALFLQVFFVGDSTTRDTRYTTSITIWMLILQRLGKGKTNNEVVKDVLSNSRQLLPDNKRVREAAPAEATNAKLTPDDNNPPGS